MVRTEPFISRESVRSVLEGMLYHSEEEHSPLEYLTLVEAFVDERRIPLAENRRLFALRSIVNHLITEQLTLHRHNFGLKAPHTRETLDEAQHAIQSDTRKQSAELIGWSLLYYRYVRVDLNLTPSIFGRISHVDERTLRRYQTRSVERLRDVLVEREAHARIQKKQLFLRRAMPTARLDGIVGRSSLVEEVYQLLRFNPPSHLLITGATGIGKTSFAQLLVCRLIEADEIDNIVWISGAGSSTFIERHIRQTLLPDDFQLELKDYLASQRVAIVLDDVELLLKDIDLLRSTLLGLAAAAVMIVIHSSRLQLTEHFKHIVLPPISKRDVLDLTDAARSLWTEERNLKDYGEHLWLMTGGNPRAVKLAVNSLNNIDLQPSAGLSDAFLHNLIQKSFYSLQQDAKRTLYIMALCPPNTLSGEVFTTLWPRKPISPEIIVELISAGFIQEVDQGRYGPSAGVQRFIQRQYAIQQEVQKRIDHLIDEFTHCLLDQADICWPIAEHILLSSWPELPLNRRQMWVELACDFGIQHGNFAAWASILGEQGDTNLSLNLRFQYALCLRKLGEPSQADRVIRSVIEEAGHAGGFLLQGRALLECGILLREQGLYERAYSNTTRAHSAFKRLGDVKLCTQAEVELAQINLDTGRLAEAREIVRPLNLHTLRLLSLQCEIHLGLGALKEAQGFATEAITLCQPNSAPMGRLCVQLGRVHQSMGEWLTSERLFTEAVVILETCADHFALARAKTNLAAILMSHRRDYHDARKLLLDAREIQTVIRDRHGLMITLHNLTAIDHQEGVDGL